MSLLELSKTTDVVHAAKEWHEARKSVMMGHITEPDYKGKWDRLANAEHALSRSVVAMNEVRK